MLSMDDRFSWFLETLKECNKDMVEMSDEDIETYIFEDFDIDIISVFYKDVLKEFRDNGYINDIIYKKATMLRKKVLLLQHKDFWNIESFRKVMNGKKFS